MARLSRIVVPNQPLHIMHRGNNRQNIFESDEDMVRIKEDIAHSLLKLGCSLYAYVIMPNHLHLLITPNDKQQLTRNQGVSQLDFLTLVVEIPIEHASFWVGKL